MIRSVHRLSQALFAALIACALPSSAEAEDRALIVGINKYAHLDPNSQLSASINDAHLIEKIALERWAFKPAQIKLLFDETATADGIRSAMDNWLIAGTAVGDRVLFYYSGHGSFQKDTDGDEPDGKDETLVGSDAKVTPQGVLNMVSDDEISARLKQLKGRQVMVVADSCHSGTITRALDPNRRPGVSVRKTPRWISATRGGGLEPEPDISLSAKDFATQQRGNTIFRADGDALSWTAAAPTQLAQEDVSTDPAPRNGVFTRAFADGLTNLAADANKDGQISASELLQFVRNKSQSYCANFPCETGMTPTFEPGGTDLARDMLVFALNDIPASGGATSTPPAPQPGPVQVTPPGPAQVTPPGPAAGAADPASVIPASGSAFAVGVEVTPGQAIKLGQEIRLKISSSKPGYLVALDVRDDGKVVQLFPSSCAPPERQVGANAPLLMPDPTYGCVFTATEVGRGKIMAIVSQDNVPLESLLAKNKGLDVIPNPSGYMGQLAQSLMGVWTGDDRNRPVTWGLATTPYEIVP